MRWERTEADFVRLARRGRRLLSFIVASVLVRGAGRDRFLRGMAGDDWSGVGARTAGLDEPFLGEYA